MIDHKLIVHNKKFADDADLLVLFSLHVQNQVNQIERKTLQNRFN